MGLHFENKRKYNLLLTIFGKSVSLSWKIVRKNQEKIREKSGNFIPGKKWTL